ncbi:MAG TPA: GTP cyclohydrolase I FolE [Chthonomonadaceae bacterium]|nr:GTP cyclohydrolase I FolE [Chthonomonadaceae bacterium]
MKNRLEEIYYGLLEEVGENPEREGLVKTPHRAAEAMRFLTGGYKQSLEKIVNGAIFHEDSDNMVIVRDIEFFSLCEHHLIPFFGRANIAYIPDGKIIGLSKLARITDMYARRLQVQERLTVQIAEAIQQVLEPKGVAVVLQAKHLCMMARGVEKQSSDMVTSHVLGVFRTDRSTRAEFMNLLTDHKSY